MTELCQSQVLALGPGIDPRPGATRNISTIMQTNVVTDGKKNPVHMELRLKMPVFAILVGEQFFKVQGYFLSR